MSPVKGWIVDNLAGGLFQGNRGPLYWAAVSARLLWGRGFESAWVNPKGARDIFLFLKGL